MTYKNVMVSNHFLCNYAGSELLTLEKAKYFTRLGAKVYVAFFVLSEKLKKEFDQLGVVWVNLNGETFPDVVIDLFWGHHFTTFDRVLLVYGINPGKVIFSSLSPYESLECPPVYHASLNLITANSVETLNILHSLGVEEKSSVVFENSVFDEYFVDWEGDRKQILNKIAVISNHVPAELIDAVNLLNKSYSVDVYGVEFESVLITPEVLLEYDLVITIGRTVQQCFALRVPVFCYDRFGGPGYLDKNNYLRAAEFNFSGRCCSLKLDAGQLFENIVSGYSDSLELLGFFKEIALSRYRFSSQVELLLDRLSTESFLGVPNSIRLLLNRQSIFLEQHAVASVQEEEANDSKYMVDRWLAKRVLSASQERLIDGFFSDKLKVVHLSVALIGFYPSADKCSAVKSRIEALASRLPGMKLKPFFLEDQDCVVEGINAHLKDAVEGWVVIIRRGDDLNYSGLLMAQIELFECSGVSAVSFDELYRQENGGLGAALRPSGNLDYLLSFPAGMSRHWLFNCRALLEVGGFNSEVPEAFELDAILRLINKRGLGCVGHISEPLVVTNSPVLINVDEERQVIESHLKDRGYSNPQLQAPLPGRYKIVYGHKEHPLVSILIPTKNQLGMLQRCVESILEKTSYQNYEILIIDNNSDEPETIRWLNGMEDIGGDKVRVLRYPHPFNFSAMNNFAASQSVGDYLLLLNNDTAVIDAHWLDAMLNHGQRPEVGVVGAKLLFPNGTIQHAGVILGLNGPAEHPFLGEAMDAPGYMQRLQVDQNYSAVTAACMLVRKEVYFAVGGMDEEKFKVSYNDVDFCLKVRELGYLNVWTPHAVLLHEGSVSQKNEDTAEERAKHRRFTAEQDAMYEKWLPQLARDPAYNPNFSLAMPGGFKLADSQISWRPLDSIRPAPVALVHPADLAGCGHYRVMQPFLAMKGEGLLDGAISTGLMHVTDLERYNPDCIVLQRQIGDARLEAMRRMQKFSQAFKVYELDDYLPNLPLKSVHRKDMPKDILKSLRRGLSFVDRFVVSTPALAEAFAGLHGEIVVRENRLPLSWWGGLQTERRQGKKPRVGWAGGSSHTGDLELIADVVRDLADEVEWVFFGMCPEALKPYVHEFHGGVPIEQYPAKLASLNLDLGLAPLEHNLFNECKSNLRQLEYGACGIPIICTDIRPYQDGLQAGLPVTLVKNRYKDWVDAIRMHVNDLDATAKMADELQAKVHAEWMLQGKHLEKWRDAWLGK